MAKNKKNLLVREKVEAGLLSPEAFTVLTGEEFVADAVSDLEKSEISQSDTDFIVGREAEIGLHKSISETFRLSQEKAGIIPGVISPLDVVFDLVPEVLPNLAKRELFETLKQFRETPITDVLGPQALKNVSETLDRAATGEIKEGFDLGFFRRGVVNTGDEDTDRFLDKFTTGLLGSDEFGIGDLIPGVELGLAVNDINALMDARSRGVEPSFEDKLTVELGLIGSLVGLKVAGKPLAKFITKNVGKLDDTIRATLGLKSRNASVLDKTLEAERKVEKVTGEPSKLTPEPTPSGLKAKSKKAEDFITPSVKQSGELADDIAAFKAFSSEDIAKIIEGKAPPNINLKNIGTTDDIKLTLDAVGKKFKIPKKKVTHKETVAAAQDLGLTVQQLKKAVKEGRVNPELIQASRVLLATSAKNLSDLAKLYDPAKAGVKVKLELWRTTVQHLEIQQYTSGLVSQAGRTLNSAKILAGESLDDIGKLKRIIDTEIGHLGGKFDAKIDELAKALDVAISAKHINNVAKQAVQNKFWDGFTELWINGLLSGTGTLAVNIAGNTIFTLWQIPERAIAGMVGKLRNAGVKDADRVFVGESLALMKGLVEGFGEGIIAAGRAFKTGVPQVGSRAAKFDVLRPRAISSEALELSGTAGRAVDGIGRVVRTPQSLILSQDEFFKTIAVRMELNAQAYRKAMQEVGGDILGNSKQVGKRIQEIKDNPSILGGEITAKIDEFADYITFQRELGPTGRMVQGLINTKWGSIEIPVMKFIVPFLRTPVNIFKAGVLERNPAFAVFSREFRNTVKKGGAEADLALAKVSIGTLVGAVTMYHTAQGDITGRGPADPKMRQALMKQGWRPYSIRFMTGETIDGEPIYKYLSYRRLEPLAFLMGASADITEWMQFTRKDDPLREEQANTVIAALIATISENTLSKNFMGNISETLSAMADPQQHLQRWEQRFAGSFVPGIVFDIRKIKDPFIRETRTLVDALINKMPGLSESLPPVLSWDGQPIKRDEGLLFGVADPVKISEESRDIVDNEIVRLGVNGVPDENGNMVVFREALISPPGRVLLDGAVRLDDEFLYHRLVQLVGEIELPDKFSGGGKTLKVREQLTKLVESNIYKNAPEVAKAALIHDVYGAYKNTAKSVLLTDDKIHPEIGISFGAMFNEMITTAQLNKRKLFGDIDGRQNPSVDKRIENFLRDPKEDDTENEE